MTPNTISLPSQVHASLLRHLRILLLKPLAETLRCLQELVHASHDATLFLALQTFRGEVVHAVVETPLNEVGVHLYKGKQVRSAIAGTMIH